MHSSIPAGTIGSCRLPAHQAKSQREIHKILRRHMLLTMLLLSHPPLLLTALLLFWQKLASSIRQSSANGRTSKRASVNACSDDPNGPLQQLSLLQDPNKRK
ncbi:hypothetical protein NP493_972g00011 [Ridgeia piscesae]|uniref:Uncharacterized protein n=1 Tax=Ridgeia piscesae TaxID=27915 RepID=A0AAD9NKW8_RIDPI|nr:hypothetical protein NP493_972g00011 [Ridgeia piscesae]